MEEQELVCRVRVKKYRSYKEKAGKIAPNLLSRNILCRKEQSEMNHRCNGVQIVWSETLPFSDPGSAQQVLGALYYLWPAVFEHGNNDAHQSIGNDT